MIACIAAASLRTRSRAGRDARRLPGASRLSCPPALTRRSRCCSGLPLAPLPLDTADLWSLVTKKLKEYNTASQVQNCLAGGAFIDRPDASGKYMVEHCNEQEKRNRQANLTGEANRCQRVAEILQQKASELLLDAVGKGDLTRVQLRTCAKAMTTSRTSTHAGMGVQRVFRGCAQS